jgi:hypothetical protein
MVLKNEEIGLFTHLYLKKIYRLLSRKQITRALNRYKLSLNQPHLDNMVYGSKEFWKRKEKQKQVYLRSDSTVQRRAWLLVAAWALPRWGAAARAARGRSPTGESRKATTAKDSISRHRQLRCSGFPPSAFSSSPPPSRLHRGLLFSCWLMAGPKGRFAFACGPSSGRLN